MASKVEQKRNNKHLTDLKKLHNPDCRQKVKVRTTRQI